MIIEYIFKVIFFDQGNVFCIYFCENSNTRTRDMLLLQPTYGYNFLLTKWKFLLYFDLDLIPYS